VQPRFMAFRIKYTGRESAAFMAAISSLSGCLEDRQSAISVAFRVTDFDGYVVRGPSDHACRRPLRMWHPIVGPGGTTGLVQPHRSRAGGFANVLGRSEEVGDDQLIGCVLL